MNGLLIGRFQPFHKGHCHIIEHIIHMSHNPVIVIGSANKDRNLVKNPYDYVVRKHMICSVYPKITQFIAMNDSNNMEEWYNSLVNKMQEIGLNKYNVVIHYSCKSTCQNNNTR